MTLPESPATVPGYNRIERFNHRCIAHGKLVLFPVIRRRDRFTTWQDRLMDSP
ncbi:MAG: hypothetical protein ABIN99_07905 [Nitrosospira sp.]